MITNKRKSLPPIFRGRLCDSDWIRTNGPHLRRMTLYPAELPNQLLLFLGGANLMKNKADFKENEAINQSFVNKSLITTLATVQPKIAGI